MLTSIIPAATKRLFVERQEAIEEGGHTHPVAPPVQVGLDLV
jgi:hypothetical protein